MEQSLKITLPPVIFGTSCLGNIYGATPYETKLAIVKACVENSPGILDCHAAERSDTG